MIFIITCAFESRDEYVCDTEKGRQGNIDMIHILILVHFGGVFAGHVGGGGIFVLVHTCQPVLSLRGIVAH